MYFRYSNRELYTDDTARLQDHDTSPIDSPPDNDACRDSYDDNSTDIYLSAINNDYHSTTRTVRCSPYIFCSPDRFG